MHLDDNERRALAGIEADLADADPDFSRSFARSQRRLGRHVSRCAGRATAVALCLGLVLLVVALSVPVVAVLPPALALLIASPVPVVTDLLCRRAGCGRRSGT